MPLDKSQLKVIQEGIRNAEAQLKDAEKDLKDAERAGIDVTEHRKNYNALKEQLKKMKFVYGS